MAEKDGDTFLLFRSWVHYLWVTGPIPTEFEIDQDFMSVLVTCKCKEAQIKKGWENMATLFSHYNFMAFFQLSLACFSETCGPFLLKFELDRDFRVVLVTCKYKKDLIKKWPKKTGDTVLLIS